MKNETKLTSLVYIFIEIVLGLLCFICLVMCCKQDDINRQINSNYVETEIVTIASEHEISTTTSTTYLTTLCSAVYETNTSKTSTIISTTTTDVIGSCSITLNTTHTTIIETTTETTMTTTCEIIDYYPDMQFVGTFQGTYYPYPEGTLGGSGRKLIDCSIGDGEVKGSIASRSLFDMFGYDYNGQRTKVYIDCKSCESLSGYYYLDDSTAPYVLGVIDFYYFADTNCQFYGIGRLFDIEVYI